MGQGGYNQWILIQLVGHETHCFAASYPPLSNFHRRNWQINFQTAKYDPRIKYPFDQLNLRVFRERDHSKFLCKVQARNRSTSTGKKSNTKNFVPFSLIKECRSPSATKKIRRECLQVCHGCIVDVSWVHHRRKHLSGATLRLDTLCRGLCNLHREKAPAKCSQPCHIFCKDVSLK